MGTAKCPRQTEGLPTDRFPCVHKTRISDELPNGSQQKLGSFHIDPETALLQRQSYDVNRDVVCQLPPETGHPPYVAARLKKPAYGMNDASRRWGNILDETLRSFGMVPHTSRWILYYLQSRKQAWEHWIQGAIAQQHGTKDAITDSREQSEMEAAF